LRCSTSASAAKKAKRGKIKVLTKDIGCIFYHGGKAIVNGITTGYLSVRFPYDVYNMPDFDYTKVDGEPTINNVPGDDEPSKKDNKEINRQVANRAK
jgi:hypothetical protein